MCQCVYLVLDVLQYGIIHFSDLKDGHQRILNKVSEELSELLKICNPNDTTSSHGRYNY